MTYFRRIYECVSLLARNNMYKKCHIWSIAYIVQHCSEMVAYFMIYKLVCWDPNISTEFPKQYVTFPQSY